MLMKVLKSHDYCVLAHHSYPVVEVMLPSGGSVEMEDVDESHLNVTNETIVVEDMASTEDRQVITTQVVVEQFSDELDSRRVQYELTIGKNFKTIEIRTMRFKTIEIQTIQFEIVEIKTVKMKSLMIKTIEIKIMRVNTIEIETMKAKKTEIITMMLLMEMMMMQTQRIMTMRSCREVLLKTNETMTMKLFK